MIQEEYYEPKDIKFTVVQVKWLLGFLPSLKEGIYPPNPRETGYRDEGTTKPSNPHAPFETSCMIAGELEARLSTCGIDGLYTKAVYCWGEDHQSLGINDNELYRRVGSCLRFISGSRRKLMDYHKWLKVANYRSKPYTVAVYNIKIQV